MRVIVTDDSAFMRKAISQMLASDPEIEVVAIGRNGREAVELCKKHEPDLMTMDIEMPEVDGLTALRQIMQECPTNVIMLSSLTTKGSHEALKALKIGAVDFLAKDQSNFSLSITNIKEELLSKVRAHANSKRFAKDKKPEAKAPTGAVTRPLQLKASDYDVVCIGSSTGGPPQLETILTALPESMRIPVVVAQHMPELFTRSLSERLDRECALQCVHAQDGMPLEPYTIYIAPGGHHLHLEKKRLAQWEIRVNDLPVEAVYKPSVDALLGSAANSFGRRALGVVLTGIGQDGMLGAKDLVAAGGKVFAQDEQSCVVYGMPRAIVDNDLAAAVLTPEAIAQTLATLDSGQKMVTRRSG